MVSRFDVYNNIPHRKAARKGARLAAKDQENAIDRARRAWASGLFDPALTTAPVEALPKTKKAFQITCTHDAAVTLYCPISRTFVTGHAVRRINMRARGIFILCRLSDNIFKAAPLSLVYDACLP